jgi:ketosteroid isomerase-like protein
MCSDANKNLVRRYVEMFNRGEMEKIFDELSTEDVVIQGVLGKGGRDIVLPIWNELHSGLAMKLTITEMVAEGDTVAVLIKETGRSQGVFRGMQPTGKSYEIVAMEWFQFRSGKIAARWGARDSAAIMRQIAPA